jgi:hypothetical protein
VSTLIPFLVPGKPKHPRKPDHTKYFEPMMFSEDVVFASSQSRVFVHGAGVGDLSGARPSSAQSSEADLGFDDDIDAAMELRKAEKRKVSPGKNQLPKMLSGKRLPVPLLRSPACCFQLQAVYKLYADSRQVDDWITIERTGQRNWTETFAISRQRDLGMQNGTTAKRT